MMRRKFFALAAFMVFVSFACRKPFDPESIGGFKSALIVEGMINSAGATNIYLSRTLDLEDKLTSKPELNALVQIISENNTALTLSPRAGGLYSISQLNLDPAQKYRLKIKTSAGDEYLSDPLSVKNTPPIDKLTWVKEADGIGIYVDAQDPQNSTRYYQWDFEEDWELLSREEAMYRADPIGGSGAASIALRTSSEIPPMYRCYKANRSTYINIFSTAALKSDVVAKHQVAFIPNDSEKVSVRYSILVRQYAVSFEGFEYLSMMKRNTEQLGSFFDAQPSELRGNIRHVADPNDVAIGFVGITSIQEKRIFISRGELGNWGFRLNCQSISVFNHRDSLAIYLAGTYIPTTPQYSASGAILRWDGTETSCLDCRVRGGNNNRPSFW